MGCVLLLGGCSRTEILTPEQDEIRFGAESVLLHHDAPNTKFGTLKTEFDQASESVGNGSADRFFVYGTKTISSTRYNTFTGHEVMLHAIGDYSPYNDNWDYSPHEYWDSNASQYDFLAISGPSSASNISCNPASSAHIIASVTYNPTVAQYDLLAAGYQRTDNSTGTVHFSFDHILSAVSVVIYNDSPEIPVTLNAFNFRNICINAIGLVEQNGNGLAVMSPSSWTNPAYTSSRVLGFTADPNAEPPVPAQTLTSGTHYPTVAAWDLMIPQSLEPYGGYIPQLYLDYEYDQENPHNPDQIDHNHPMFPINLEEIHVKNSDSYITSWEPGRKYIYEIHIRLGGGINVTVSVTDWEAVPAETPGLTISE